MTVGLLPSGEELRHDTVGHNLCAIVCFLSTAALQRAAGMMPARVAFPTSHLPREFHAAQPFRGDQLPGSRLSNGDDPLCIKLPPERVSDLPMPAQPVGGGLGILKDGNVERQVRRQDLSHAG